MALLSILSVPHPLLRQVALPVEAVTDSVRCLMDDMFDTMIYKDRGVGLAANQIGILKRVIVCHYTHGQEIISLKMANPKIITISNEKFTLTEGCLSVPQAWSDVTRPKTVIVEYLDYNGVQQKLQVTDEMSSIIQHEIDHLDGKLFIDHLSSTKKRLMLDRALKAGH